jgi:hypothetical protein
MDELKICKSGCLALVGLGFLLAGVNNSAFATVSDIGTPKLVVASNIFIFNPRTLSWKAVANGKVIKAGKASGGSRYCRDIGRSCRTPSGTYHVISKGSADCRSSRYPVGKGGAKMPYCMYFSKNYAVHGSYELPDYNASHGCIRIQPEAARWLSNNFMHIGTPVIVQPY